MGSNIIFKTWRVCIYILRKYDKSFFSEVLRGWTDSATTVLPIITELLNNNIRVCVYRYGQQLSDASVSLMQQFGLEIELCGWEVV